MRAIFLSVAGLGLTACTMAGPGGYTHVSSPCGATHTVVSKPKCAPAYYASKPTLQHSYGSAPSGYPVYPLKTVHSGSYPVVSTPSAHAYGTHAGYAGHYTHHGLRKAPVAHRPYSYGSVGAVMYDIEDDAFGIQGRFGHQFHPIFGAEVEGSLGVIDDNVNVNFVDPNDATNTLTGEADAGVDYSLGAFATARFPLSHKVKAFGRAGYHITETKTVFEDGAIKLAISEETDDFAYGGGLEFMTSPRDAIRVDYTRYEEADLDAVSVSYLRRF